MKTLMRKAYEAMLMVPVILAGIILAAIAIAIPVDTFSRFLFSKSLVGMTDLVENGLMIGVFASVPWVLYQNDHVAVELFLQLVSKRMQQWLSRLVCMLGFSVCVVFLWYGVETLLITHERDMTVRRVLSFPQWWTYVPFVICFFLCTCEFLRQLLTSFEFQKN